VKIGFVAVLGQEIAVVKSRIGRRRLGVALGIEMPLGDRGIKGTR